MTDQLLMSDCNGLCQLSYLGSPLLDFYVFEGCETFSEAESSFVSTNTEDDQPHLHFSSFTFDSSKHQGEAQEQSSCCQEFSGDCSWSWEELMGNENKKVCRLVRSVLFWFGSFWSL